MINTIQQAVILAGGRGERLKPLTDDLPKPMAPINGLPFLDYLIESIRLAGISNILFLLGYKAEKIIERYGMGIGRMKIEYSVGDVTDQTGKRLQNAYNQLDAQFLLMYGDTYWPIEFNQMIQSYYQSSCMVSMTVFTNIRGTGGVEMLASLGGARCRALPTPPSNNNFPQRFFCQKDGAL